MTQGINPFVIIVDREGDVVTTISASSTIDYIFSMLEIYNKDNATYAPHLAFEWKDGYFARVDDCHPTVTTREVKLRNLGFEDLTENQSANIQLGRNLI